MVQLTRMVGVAALAMVAGCGASVAAPAAPIDSIVTIDGPLKLTVSDAPATPGVFFIAASVVPSAGMVTVSSTRYGSLCALAVSGHADVTGTQITLHVTYSDRSAICTADIRATTYRAEITGLTPGAYDVHVVHTGTDGTTSTVVTQRVTVT